MKKLYIFTLLLTQCLTQAQLSENFDAGTTLPTGWASFRGTNGLGTTQDWQSSTTRSYSAPNSFYVRYEDVTGGTAEDWLVTPLIDLTNRTGASLTFYGGQQYTSAYGTVYQIKVSTTSQTSHASFTNVATYAEADFTDITTTTLASLKTVDLSAYNGQQIYIAFVMTQDDGDNWFIDDVNVTSTLGVEDFNANFKITMYPNPTSSIIKINSNEPIGKVQVFGITGVLLKNLKNVNQVDISSFPAGSYIIKTETVEGNFSTQKILKL